MSGLKRLEMTVYTNFIYLFIFAIQTEGKQ